MDKSIYTALNSMQILRSNQSVSAQNLSNTNVPGFKKDIQANFGSLYLDREKGIDPRVFALSDVGAFDSSQGALNPTERPLDVGIDGDGYFIVKPKSGKLALSRRGDFKIDQNRILTDNTGAQIYNVDLEPIERGVEAFYKIRMVITNEYDLKSFRIFEESGNQYNYTITKLIDQSDLTDDFFTFDLTKYPEVELIDFR